MFPETSHWENDVACATSLAPAADERCLERILGAVGVAEDQPGDSVETVDERGHQEIERATISLRARRTSSTSTTFPRLDPRSRGRDQPYWVGRRVEGSTKVPAAVPPTRQPTWTSLTIRRYWLFDPTQVWSVMLGRLWAAQAHDAAVVGAVTRHQITL